MQERFQNVYTLIERNKKFAYNLFNEAESISTKVKAITRLCTTSLCNISSESANFMMMNSTIILNELIKTRLDIESTIHVCNNLLNFLNARMKPNEVKKPHNESKPNDNQLIDTKKSTDEDFFTPMLNKQRRRTRRNDISSNMNKYLGVLRDWKQVRLGKNYLATKLNCNVYFFTFQFINIINTLMLTI